MLGNTSQFLSKFPENSAEVTTAIDAAIAVADNAVVKTVRLAISYTPATQTSTITIPANARIVRTTLVIGTAFDGTPTIKSGFSGTLDRLFATTNNDPTMAGEVSNSHDKAWHTSAAAVVTTIGGTPAQGTASLVIEYCETPLGP